MLKVIVHILYLPMHGIISDHQLSALHSKLWILVRFSVWYPLTHSIVNCDSEWSSLFKVFAFGRFGGHFITTSNKQAYYISHLIFLFNSYFFSYFLFKREVSFQGKGRLAIKKILYGWNKGRCVRWRKPEGKALTSVFEEKSFRLSSRLIWKSKSNLIAFWLKINNLISIVKVTEV